MTHEYARFMDEYLRCGHMRALTDAELQSTSGPLCYIAHHGIWQAGDHHRKLHVVFNASRPTSTEYSLNDILHSAPKLQTALPIVLLRWRRHRIAFCADVRMMFRQIWIDRRDVNLQRIVWSADETVPPQHFQLLTVTYGETCAPYLSLRAVEQLCRDEGHAWPDAVPIVMKDRYADDILSGADDVPTARALRDQVIGLLQAGGFPLRKWVANSPQLLDDLATDVRLRPTWRQLSADGLISELGISWDPTEDCFHVAPPTLQPQQTKRAMLASLARLFDPCGWLAPVILIAKLIIQDLWRARLDWDEIVPASMTRRWAAFLHQLQDVYGIRIPRWLGCHPSSQLQLHAFGDASRRAMAAVVYSRVQDESGRVSTRILLARTKLTPIKSLQPQSNASTRMTIPRLELRASLLAARLLRQAAKELAVPLEQCFAWSDSQIVLHWLRSSQPTNNSLIDNYVAHIQELLPSGTWRHVPTASKPADVASRGATLSTLETSAIWWTGPDWLSDKPDSWPDEPADHLQPVIPPRESTFHACCTTLRHHPTLLERFSSLSSLLRFMVRVRRWVRRRRHRHPTSDVLAPPTALELHEAYLACVRLSQEDTFRMELQCLRKGDRLPAKHSLSSLDPIISDPDGVLRVGGRLQHSALSFDEQHPPILSGQCKLAIFVVRWAHTRALHGGARLTGAYASQRAWIIGGRRLVKGLLKRCVVCVRLQARLATQHMAPLPASRVTPARAFLRTDIDYAGPFNVVSAKGRSICTSKGYIAVFVCMTTKAIHLELVGDLLTESFLDALTRFCSCRGRPAEIWNDNATCFRAADRELREALQTTRIGTVSHPPLLNKASSGSSFRLARPISADYGRPASFVTMR